MNLDSHLFLKGQWQLDPEQFYVMLRTSLHNSEDSEAKTSMEYLEWTTKEGPCEQFKVMRGTVPPTSSMISTVSDCPLSTLSHRINPSRGGGHQILTFFLDEMA